MKGTTQHCYIVKAPDLYAKVENLEFVKTRCDDASEIFKNTYEAVDANQFTTVLPFVSDDIPERSRKHLSTSSCIQPIVLEFDYCPMTMQEERVKFLAEKLQTPMFVVHSGNKSLHHYIYFAKFADTVDEYKRKCQQFVAYLAKEYPTYFKVREHDKEKHPLVPDYLMFTGNRYARQANGKRDHGKVQLGKILHGIGDEGITDIDITPFLSEYKSGNYKGSRGSKTSMPEQKQPRKATLSFIAMGTEAGFRDDDCFRAACDLKDCGFSKDEVYNKLLEGANKCRPPFNESDVRAKVESAWNSEGLYDPIDRTRPYVFIEKSSGSYWHLIDNKLNYASKDVIKDIFKSYNAPFPDPMPVLEFKFDVHDDRQIDLANRTFNLFTPTNYHRMKKNDKVILPRDFPMINNLLDNLLPVASEKKHLLNWLACILQTRRKLMTAYVLKGAQGAGKNLFFGHIIGPLLGEAQTVIIEDEQLKSTFNGAMKNVCFIAFNEVAHDNSGRNALNSKIKSLITDPVIIINEKYVKPYAIKNYANCMFFSNESVPLLVEKSDRRFNVVETGGPLTATSWFNAEKVIPELGQELNAFAQYLWNVDIDIAMANTAIRNDLKEKMISAGMNRFEEFAAKRKDADIEWFLNNIDKEYPSWDGGSVINEEMLASTQEKKISKEVAHRLFNRINPESKTSIKKLTIQLSVYGIGDGRDNDVMRTRIYRW